MAGGGPVAPAGKGGEDLNHHALEQLPGLAYCINDNPRWREYFHHVLTLC